MLKVYKSGKCTKTRAWVLIVLWPPKRIMCIVGFVMRNECGTTEYQECFDIQLFDVKPSKISTSHWFVIRDSSKLLNIIFRGVFIDDFHFCTDKLQALEAISLLVWTSTHCDARSSCKKRKWEWRADTAELVQYIKLTSINTFHPATQWKQWELHKNTYSVHHVETGQNSSTGDRRGSVDVLDKTRKNFKCVKEGSNTTVRVKWVVLVGQNEKT